MIGYTVSMVLFSILFFVIAALIYKGKTELIHDYHRNNVTDKVGYGKAFGKSLGIMAVGTAASGVVGLWGERLIWLALVVLFAGYLIGSVGIFITQKKYNGGVFS